MKRLLAIVLCLCLLLCGCSTPQGDPYTPTGNALTPDGESGEQGQNGQSNKAPSVSLPYYKDKSLNPYTCADFTNRVLFSLLYQSLFTVDKNYAVEPQLCKNYKVSEDMLTYTFYPEAATFSDGNAVTAADIAASLNAARENIYYQGRLSHVKEIVTTDDGGVAVHLNVPYEDFLILLDIPIVPASQVAAEQPIGTGPYFLYPLNGHLTLRKNANWWCTNISLPIKAASITLTEATSVNHIRDQFEFSDLSLACTDPGSDRYADYRCDYELWEHENGIFLYLAVCNESTLFQNTALRASLTYAIDRDLLVTEFYRGFARSATLPASPASPYYNGTLAQRYGYDSAKFAQAVTDAQATGSEVIFLVSTDDSLRLRVARKIGKALEAGGLKVTMQELGGEEYTAALKAKKFDIYLGQTRLSANMDLSAFFKEGGSLSLGGMDDVSAYSLSLQALENHGNYFTLHKQVMDKGLLCPILFRSYAIYSARGVVSDLTPVRDNLFYYSLGKSLENAKLPA